MLALGPLLSQVSGKDGVPVANVFCGIVKGIAQIAETAFLHMRIAIFELPGLVS